MSCLENGPPLALFKDSCGGFRGLVESPNVRNSPQCYTFMPKMCQRLNLYRWCYYLPLHDPRALGRCRYTEERGSLSLRRDATHLGLGWGHPEGPGQLIPSRKSGLWGTQCGHTLYLKLGGPCALPNMSWSLTPPLTEVANPAPRLHRKAGSCRGVRARVGAGKSAETPHSLPERDNR